MASNDGSTTASHPSFPDPRLPRELERTIFEISATLSRPNRIPNLMLVAQRVRVWVEPSLYRVVFLDEELPPLDGFPRFTWTVFTGLLTTKPQDFFARSVRNLLIGTKSGAWSSNDVRLKEIHSILRACSGITNLCAFQGLRVSELISPNSLKRFAVHTFDLFSKLSGIDLSTPAFCNTIIQHTSRSSTALLRLIS
ncbi:hypothetical protein FB45DRAFT_1055705 [Roridomyces roridus]|uniref:Uncharacterized protein n=1 Tax=Roridomyces roridus TaxID=1738132 RepID=A0AAD7FT47_9AGAR|nr:hypothetical protein FB45DRAFT_1055705 [Roridomyces roridus]